MFVARHLLSRNDNTAFNPTILKLLIALLVIVVTGLALVSILFAIRHVRKTRKTPILPTINGIYASKLPNERRFTMTSSYKRPQSVCIYQNNSFPAKNSSNTLRNSIPEIRITFPEETDEHGEKRSGRVVIVRVGDHSVGLEPFQDDLPPYQRDYSSRFQSLDLERIGGLNEKGNQ